MQIFLSKGGWSELAAYIYIYIFLWALSVKNPSAKRQKRITLPGKHNLSQMIQDNTNSDKPC